MMMGRFYVLRIILQKFGQLYKLNYGFVIEKEGMKNTFLTRVFPNKTKQSGNTKDNTHRRR